MAKKYGAAPNRKVVSEWVGLIMTMDQGIKTSRAWLKTHGGALPCADPDVTALTDCFREEYITNGYCPDEAFERCGYQSLDGPVTTCTW